jgi:hypothetical protein
MNDKRMVMASLLAIRRHARRVQNQKSHFCVNSHMDAIIALANLGLKSAKKIKEING